MRIYSHSLITHSVPRVLFEVTWHQHFGSEQKLDNSPIPADSRMSGLIISFLTPDFFWNYLVLSSANMDLHSQAKGESFWLTTTTAVNKPFVQGTVVGLNWVFTSVHLLSPSLCPHIALDGRSRMHWKAIWKSLISTTCARVLMSFVCTPSWLESEFEEGGREEDTLVKSGPCT